MRMRRGDITGFEDMDRPAAPPAPAKPDVVYVDRPVFSDEEKAAMVKLIRAEVAKELKSQLAGAAGMTMVTDVTRNGQREITRLDSRWVRRERGAAS